MFTGGITSGFFDFEECEVQASAGPARISAGRHVVIDQGQFVSVRTVGRALEVPTREWQRLVGEQKVKEV